MRYEYFVSYAHSAGFGNCGVTRDKKLESIEEIKILCADIEKSHNGKMKNLVILNFKLLRELKKNI